jgi:hypothetical protein
MVGEETEEKLAEEGTDGVSDLDAEVLVRGAGTTLVVDVADHRGGDGDGEDVVRIGEKSDTWSRL